MTKKQAEALKFIDGFIKENGYSPSYREVTEGLNLSSISNAHRLIHGLVSHGKVKILQSRARSLEVVNPQNLM